MRVLSQDMSSVKGGFHFVDESFHVLDASSVTGHVLDEGFHFVDESFHVMDARSVTGHVLGEGFHFVGKVPLRG